MDPKDVAASLPTNQSWPLASLGNYHRYVPVVSLSVVMPRQRRVPLHLLKTLILLFLLQPQPHRSHHRLLYE